MCTHKHTATEQYTINSQSTVHIPGPWTGLRQCSVGLELQTLWLSSTPWFCEIQLGPFDMKHVRSWGHSFGSDRSHSGDEGIHVTLTRWLVTSALCPRRLLWIAFTMATFKARCPGKPGDGKQMIPPPTALRIVDEPRSEHDASPATIWKTQGWSSSWRGRERSCGLTTRSTTTQPQAPVWQLTQRCGGKRTAHVGISIMCHQRKEGSLFARGIQTHNAFVPVGMVHIMFNYAKRGVTAVLLLPKLWITHTLAVTARVRMTYLSLRTKTPCRPN